MTTTQVEAKQLFIDGRWQDAVGGRRAEVIDPSTGAVVATVAEADADDVDAAVAAARAAFESWAARSPRERSRILHRIADLIRGVDAAPSAVGTKLRQRSEGRHVARQHS